MRKNFGPQTWLYPMPVLIVGTYDENGRPDAMNAACRDFGENRPDDLLAKYAVYPLATWHFIGNIQSRRIDDIALCASYVHSLSQLKHAQKLSRCCQELGKA